MFKSTEKDNGLVFIKKFVMDNAMRGIPDPDLIPADDSLPGPFILRGVGFIPEKDWSPQQKNEYRIHKRKANQIRFYPIVLADKVIHIDDHEPSRFRPRHLINCGSPLYM